jgi:DNA replication protein DnaC
MSRGPSPLNSAQRSCPLGACDGSGWIFGPEDVARPCECRERRLSQARSRGVASVIPAKYRGVGFDRPPVLTMDRTVVGVVRDYVEAIDENLDAGRGLWLMGDVGTGKTTLAMLVSKLALEAGRTVAIYSLPHLLSRIRRTYEAAAGEDSYLEFFERLTSVDLLHIDDLGVEKRSDWVLEQLYAIVNDRYESQRSVIVTTNLDESALEEQIGPRTVSRLVEICGDPLPLFGDDMRFRLPA